MQFGHHDAIWSNFPSLSALCIAVAGDFPAAANTLRQVASDTQEAAIGKLNEKPEGSWSSIQAWRRAFASMGLKPTQTRCASESLMRRLRLDGSIPSIHPLVDLCNAVSTLSGIPIAAFDLDKIQGNLEVRFATGAESYESIGGSVESPEPREVVFADSIGRAHSRRWAFRQSGFSAIREDSNRALIVAEALHDEGSADLLLVGHILSMALSNANLSMQGPSVLQSTRRTFEVASKGLDTI